MTMSRAGVHLPTRDAGRRAISKIDVGAREASRGICSVCIYSVLSYEYTIYSVYIYTYNINLIYSHMHRVHHTPVYIIH